MLGIPIAVLVGYVILGVVRSHYVVEVRMREDNLFELIGF